MVDAELMEIGTGIDIVQIIEGDAHRMVGEHRLLANQLWASRLLCDGALVSGRTRISSRFDPVDREMEKRPEAGGERAAAALVTTLGAKFEIARELVYRLYTVCERKKGAAEALGQPWDYAPLHDHLHRAAAAGRFSAGDGGIDGR